MGLRVLELYCGIGGYHWALKMASEEKLQFEVVAAVEINPVVLDIYKHNFPDANIWNRNIGALTAAELNMMDIDIIAMSPPCQPFCRTGLQMDVDDERTNSFTHLLEILPQIKFKYLIMENVKGFESSLARNVLIEALRKCNFHWQEYLLSPFDLGIPNSRLRYYLIGKHHTLNWSYQISETIQTTIPLYEAKNINEGLVKQNPPYASLMKSQIEIWNCRRQEVLLSGNFNNITHDSPRCVADIMEVVGTGTENKRFQVRPSIQAKYEKAMDIVQPHSTSTCCFTKSYGHYVKGTGSVLLCNTDSLTTGCNELRFFTPREVLRLMCYSDLFQFPSTVSIKQQYRAVGNSLNVYVVAVLISLLIET